MKPFLVLTMIFGCVFSLQAQKPVDIKLVSTAAKEGAECFDIMLRSSAGHDIHLAGQNYRLFFNGEKTTFRPDLITHNLDRKSYGSLDIQNTAEQSIGFVSISLDSKKFTDKIIALKREGSWVQTMNLCFDHDKSSTLDLTWANSKKTSRFATAEITFSEWVTPQSQQMLEANVVLDYSSADYASTSDDLELTLYPNPVSEILQVELNGNTQMRRLVIKDIIGREYVTQDFDGKNVESYDVSSWPEGSYTVILSDADGGYLESKKIIKITQ